MSYRPQQCELKEQQRDTCFESLDRILAEKSSNLAGGEVRDTGRCLWVRAPDHVIAFQHRNNANIAYCVPATEFNR